MSLLLAARCSKSLDALPRIELVGVIGLGFAIFTFVAESVHYIPFDLALGIAIAIGAIVLVTAFWCNIKKLPHYFQWPIKHPQKEKEIHQPSTIREPTIDVCNQDDLSPLSELFGNTEREIMIQGITLERLNHIRSSIATAAKQGKKVRILLCHPQLAFMGEIETLVDSTDTKNRIQSCINMLYQTKDRLGSDDKQNFEIKCHNHFPTMSLVIKDDYMQIEPYPSKTPQDKRKNFRINRNEQRQLFDVYRKAFENLLNDAKPADRTAPRHVP